MRKRNTNKRAAAAIIENTLTKTSGALHPRRENVQADYYLFNGLVNYPVLDDDQMFEEMDVANDGLDKRWGDTEDYFLAVYIPALQEMDRRFEKWKRPGLAAKRRGWPTFEQYVEKKLKKPFNTVKSWLYRAKLRDPSRHHRSASHQPPQPVTTNRTPLANSPENPPANLNHR